MPVWLNDLYQHLDPIAFSWGPITVRWYGLAYLMGFVLGAYVIWRIQKRWKLGYSSDELMSIMIGLAFGVIIGGRLGYVLFYGAGYYLSHPLSIFMLSEGGMSFHGGLVGAVIGGYLACRSLRVSFPTMCDLGVIAAPVGLFFGRCANFVNGELWGKPTSLPWGVMFETGGNVYRHPSQLYEALLEGVVMFCVMIWLSRRRPARPQGTFLGTFLMLYGIFRFLVEFVRVPDEQLGYLIGGTITMGQILSLPLVVIGVAILVIANRRQAPQVGHIGLEAEDEEESDMGETDIDEAFEDDTWDGVTDEDEDGTRRAKSRHPEARRHVETDAPDDADGVADHGWDGFTSDDEDGSKTEK